MQTSGDADTQIVSISCFTFEYLHCVRITNVMGWIRARSLWTRPEKDGLGMLRSRLWPSGLEWSGGFARVCQVEIK